MQFHVFFSGFCGKMADNQAGTVSVPKSGGKIMNVIDRFLKLAVLESTSDEASETCPSTANQRNVAEEIVRQLQEIGIADAHIDEHGYVYATVPANCDDDIPVFGLIAHMDTSPDASGSGVKPRITEPYDGGDVLLNAEKNIVLSPRDYPSLLTHLGKHLIVTDGTTLLGSDDKAGAAEIIAAAEALLHTEQKHGKIRLGFTPDEEIGRGADLFDVPGFGADYAYTVDGGALGEIEYENFNAAGATVVIHGISIHPGSAKDKMVNSALLAMELNAMLPAQETPGHTEGYEGFYHLTGISGECEETRMHYIIRDHDREKFEKRKQVLAECVAEINRKYGENTAELDMKDSYYNMKEKIEPCMFLISAAQEAFRENGTEAVCVPIRGGTDGARLSFEGLPCPNLCTGGENFHGRFEYAVAEDMELIADTLMKLMLKLADGRKDGK